MEVESNDIDPEFKVNGHEKITKYKNTFAKGYIQKLPEEHFVIKKVQKYCTMNICNRRP